MITLKSKRELDLIRDASRIVAEVLGTLREHCEPGVRTIELDRIAEDVTTRLGGKPAFKGYRGFPGSICASINEEVVHGIPCSRQLKEGDIIGIDFGVLYNGYFGDAAITVPIGDIPASVQRLLRVTEESLYKGIEKMVMGNYLTDVSGAIQKHAEGNGFSVVKEFGGHGIGRSLHEEPMVFNYVTQGRGIKLKPGLVLAIEPMINLGADQVRILSDGWTVVTLDHKASAHFEHTVAITENGPEILTTGNRG